MTKENFRKTAVRNNMRDTGQTYTQASEELRETDIKVKPDLKLPKKSLPTFDNIITSPDERKYLLETIFEPYTQQDVYREYGRLFPTHKPQTSNPVILVIGDSETGKSLFIKEYMEKLSETRLVGYLPGDGVHDRNQITVNITAEPDKNPNLNIFSKTYSSPHYPTECLIRTHQLGLDALGMDIELTNLNNKHERRFFNETASDPDRSFLIVGRMHSRASQHENLLEKIKTQYDEHLNNFSFIDLNDKELLFSKTQLEIEMAKLYRPTFGEYAAKYLQLTLLNDFPDLRAESSMRSKVNAVILLTRTNKITGPEFDHELIIL